MAAGKTWQTFAVVFLTIYVTTCDNMAQLHSRRGGNMARGSRGARQMGEGRFPRADNNIFVYLSDANTQNGDISDTCISEADIDDDCGYSVVSRKRQRVNTGGKSNGPQFLLVDDPQNAPQNYDNLSTDEKLSLILSKVSLNENRVIQIQNKLDTVLDLKRRVSSVECVVTSHANRLKLLEYRSLDIEARSRRHNLLFKGIAEDRRENCFDKVRRFIREELNIERDLYLERAHRLGKYIHGKTRPIIVAFRDFYDIEKILGSAPNLRGTAYGISRDYPNEISKARNSLWKQFKDIRDNNKNKKVSLGFPAKIMVDNAVVVDLFPDWFEILRDSRVDLAPEKNESRNRNEYHPVQITNTISTNNQMTRPASNNENIDLTPVTVDRNTTDLSQTQFPLTQNSACDQSSSMNESESQTVSLNNNIEIVPSQNEIGIDLF